MFYNKGTGLFPPPSISSHNGPIQSSQSGESLLPASSLIRDHEQQFRLISEGAVPFSPLIASTHNHFPLYNLRGDILPHQSTQMLTERNQVVFIVFQVNFLELKKQSEY